MSTIRSFTDLVAWKEAHKLVIMIYQLTKKFPKDEQYGLVTQMRRAAVSVTSNLSEGFSRRSYVEKNRFYSIATGSLVELQNQSLVARDVEYITKRQFKELADQSVAVHKLINGLIKSSRTKY